PGDGRAGSGQPGRRLAAGRRLRPDVPRRGDLAEPPALAVPPVRAGTGEGPGRTLRAPEHPTRRERLPRRPAAHERDTAAAGRAAPGPGAAVAGPGVRSRCREAGARLVARGGGRRCDAEGPPAVPLCADRGAATGSESVGAARARIRAGIA